MTLIHESPGLGQDWLDCDHCGGPAITSPTGLFRDGDGDKCMSCGFPGMVVCDSETEAAWQHSDEPGDVCADLTCEDCKEYR